MNSNKLFEIMYKVLSIKKQKFIIKNYCKCHQLRSREKINISSQSTAQMAYVIKLSRYNSKSQPNKIRWERIKLVKLQFQEQLYFREQFITSMCDILHSDYQICDGAAWREN